LQKLTHVVSQEQKWNFIQRSADSAHFFTLGKTPFCRQSLSGDMPAAVGGTAAAAAAPR